MKSILNSIIFRVVLALFLGTFAAQADPYAKGSTVKAFSAKDQHEQAYTFDAKNTRYLLVSHDMDTGKKANGALSVLGKDHLPGKKAVYIANIHGMPGIGRMFALPKMKKYNHRIILGDDAELIANFPEQKGKVTVLGLSSGKVTSVQYWDPATEGVNNFLK
ncbi:hypothetical protein [Luteolibacter marinus]|uniref:hypothetical protein n=1 Tax=Luteolibacter marinus TaxID=2776705 RepID=UPI0018681A1D|nr:hypothetical protein [Luteolibacter marinus]